MNGDERLIQLRASAGAGKTYALTERFLALLGAADEGEGFGPACARAGGKACHGWPEIMAVTFTNKAAAEMKERVVGKLKARALGQSEAPGDWTRERAALWLARILRRYDQLNIRTIDSLLNLLMRIFALEAGLSPDFEVLFGTGEVFDELFDALAARAEGGTQPERGLLERAMRTMLHLEHKKGFQLGASLRERLRGVLSHRLAEAEPCETDPALIHEALLALRGDCLDAAARLAPLLEGLSVSAHLLNYLDKLAALGPADDLPTSAMAEKDDLDACLLKASKGQASAAQEAAYAALREAYATARRGEKLLSSARDTAALVDLADLLVRDLDETLRRDRNILLNEQSAPLAERMLAGGGVPDAFCRMGTRLMHLLVDEFQDTSRAQWRALTPLAEECLSKNGGLLVVGDVKQAIYGWRGGDSRLFDEVPDQPELAAMARAGRLWLPYNWRSAPEVVEHNNAVFSRLEDPDASRATARALFGEAAPESTVAALGADVAAAFANCAQKVPEREVQAPGYVRLTRIDAEGNKDALMETVRQEMRALFDDLRSRRRPGEIAVLVRGNEEAALVADWLLGWGLPVVTENSLALGEHPLVRQLTAFLRFMDYPLDDLALWEFLAGREIFGACSGLAPEELTDWLAGLERGPLYHRFREFRPDLAQRFLSRYVRRAGFMTPYDALSEAIRDFGVLARHPDAASAVRRFLEVVHAAEKAGRQSLAAFLEYWDAEGAQEKVPLPEAVDAVRVMTIHQSKGLEFPVVVVPFHHWMFRPDGELAAVDFMGLRLLAPLRREMGAVYYERAGRMLLEQLNLLYVAWTRPEEELYCLLAATKKMAGQLPILRALRVLTQDLAWEPDARGNDVAEHGERPSAREVTPPEPAAPEAEAPAPCPAAAAPDADPEPPMSWLPRLKIHRHFSADVPREELLGGGPAYDARARGTLVHDALDRLRRAGEGLDPERAARAAVAAHAEVLPPGDDRREEIAAEVRGILDWALTIPELPGWAHRGHPECPILTPEGAEKRPDLLVTDPHETVVVEYKTGRPSPDHERQVREYMKLLATIDGVSDNARAVIIYLDLKETREVRP